MYKERDPNRPRKPNKTKKPVKPYCLSAFYFASDISSPTTAGKRKRKASPKTEPKAIMSEPIITQTEVHPIVPVVVQPAGEVILNKTGGFSFDPTMIGSIPESLMQPSANVSRFCEFSNVHDSENSAFHANALYKKSNFQDHLPFTAFQASSFVNANESQFVPVLHSNFFETREQKFN